MWLAEKSYRIRADNSDSIVPVGSKFCICFSRFLLFHSVGVSSSRWSLLTLVFRNCLSLYEFEHLHCDGIKSYHILNEGGTCMCILGQSGKV